MAAGGGAAAAVEFAYDVGEVLDEEHDDVDGNCYAFDNPLDNCCMGCFPYCVWLVWLVVDVDDEVALKKSSSMRLFVKYPVLRPPIYLYLVSVEEGNY